MRIWSIHPKYLDGIGLIACFRETLLAQKVLEGKTKDYKNHPQLIRFKESSDSLLYIGAYLFELCVEAKKEDIISTAIKFCILKKVINLIN